MKCEITFNINDEHDYFYKLGKGKALCSTLEHRVKAYYKAIFYTNRIKWERDQNFGLAKTLKGLPPT